ncbi:MAG: FAD/NAD-binding family oxidoreductase [Desulfovibrionaceae bacterium]
MAQDRREGQGEWRVARTQPESDDVTSLYLEGPVEKLGGRRPGQFAALRVWDGEGWSEPHPFTISCAPEEETLRFTIKQSGDFTSRVRELAPGTPVQCVGPFGAFCKDIDQHKEIVMVAGGVGITPFLSVLRHFRRTGADNRVVLFWSNKTPADAFAGDELIEMTRELDLKVVHAFSRTSPEGPPPSPAPDRVAHIGGRLTRDVLQEHIRTPDASFYVCGPPAMQESVIAELSACGVDPDKVQKEAFTPPGGSKK